MFVGEGIRRVSAVKIFDDEGLFGDAIELLIFGIAGTLRPVAHVVDELDIKVGVLIRAAAPSAHCAQRAGRLSSGFAWHHTRDDPRVRGRAWHFGHRTSDHARRGLLRGRGILHRNRRGGHADSRARQPANRRGPTRTRHREAPDHVFRHSERAQRGALRVAQLRGSVSDTRELPVVMVKPADLPVYCPNPAMPLWSSHPRVFLDVVDTGEARCPYRGTRYRLRAARAPRGTSLRRMARSTSVAESSSTSIACAKGQ